jgi:DNA (cytosine-5)-methyltransferase 1
MDTVTALKPYQASGTAASWHRGWDITAEQRDKFRQISRASSAAKSRALRGECDAPKHPIPVPKLKATDLMPKLRRNGLNFVSLFSGGGGLDIGFERAGYSHVASYELREDATNVLKEAHPNWKIFGGTDGDVCQVDWEQYAGQIDVLHGGPPCQPFSHAGYQSGENDVRDMFPELVRAVQIVRPRVFIAENVPGLATKKFRMYVEKTILSPLAASYCIRMFTLEAASFGVPQRRRRVWFVGFRDQQDAAAFCPPAATHLVDLDDESDDLPKTMGVREALGLPEIGYDALAPTIRSGFSGPRHTTSVVNSVTSLSQWLQLGIWPHGVAEDHEKAAAFVAKDGAFRLSIPDCMLLQGFPEDWPLRGAVYKSLGLIGNSVAPPMAYHVALAVARSLQAKRPISTRLQAPVVSKHGFALSAPSPRNK